MYFVGFEHVGVEHGLGIASAFFGVSTFVVLFGGFCRSDRKVFGGRS